MIQLHVIQEFREEIERAKEPGYVSRYDDFDVDNDQTRSTPSPPPQPETRVDQAHDPSRAHVPRSGGGASQEVPTGGQGPAPSSKTSPENPPQNEDGDFGAGIFSKD